MMATFTPGIDLPEDDPHAVYWFLYQEDRLLVQQLGDGQMVLPQASSVVELPVAPLRIQYLGRLTAAAGPIHCFSGELPTTMTAPDGFATVDLRQVFDAFDATLFGLAGRAKQIAHWDRDHQFCGRCATPMTAMEHERAKRCPACGLTLSLIHISEPTRPY